MNPSQRACVLSALPPSAAVLLFSALLLSASCTGSPDRLPESGDATSATGVVERVLAQDPMSAPQALSLFGEELFAREDSTGAVARADSLLRQAPDDVERLIAAARERRNVWQYRQAIELYSRAIELAPNDWRPYRFRGHRHLSLREFESGIRDLEHARDLAPLNWDVSYHLGLAHFLAGHFGRAADEYLRCLGLAEDVAAGSAQSESFRSCSQNATDLESRVAMLEWAARALQRAGRIEETRLLLEQVSPDWAVTENIAYHHDLLYRKGLMSEDELMAGVASGRYRLETVGFAVANSRLVEGDTAGAREILNELAADPWWPGFGRIAAEAELARLGR